MKMKSPRRALCPEAGCIRREAGELLRESGMRLLFIEAFLIACLPYTLPIYASSVIPTLLFLWEGEGTLLWMRLLLDGAVALFLLLVALPITVGLLRIAALTEAGEEAVLADLFWAFGSGSSYRIALSLSFGLFWRLGLTVAAVSGTYLLFGAWVRVLSAGTVAVAILGGVVIVMELFAAFVLSMPFFPVAWERMTLRRGEARTVRLFGRMGAGVRFFAGYFPSLLLSLFTVGVLFPADTLPKMLLAYFRYCRRWNELTIRSEELQR